MTEKKICVCYDCGEPIKFSPKDPITGRCTRLTPDRHLHVCKTKPIAINKVQHETKTMNEYEFVQKTVAKYEEKRQTEAERREEMIRMHDENITAWTNQTTIINRLAIAVENLNQNLKSMDWSAYWRTCEQNVKSG